MIQLVFLILPVLTQYPSLQVETFPLSVVHLLQSFAFHATKGFDAIPGPVAHLCNRPVLTGIHHSTLQLIL